MLVFYKIPLTPKKEENLYKEYVIKFLMPISHKNEKKNTKKVK